MMKKTFITLLLISVCGLAWGDAEIQDLDAIVSPAVTDPLHVIDDPSGTPISKKITIGDLLGVATDLDTDGVISADSVALTTQTTGNYITSITNGTYITGGDGGSEGATLTLDVTVAKDIVTTAPITGGTDNVLPGADSDLTIAITVAKDIVTTSPLTGGEDNVLPGADADLTIAVTIATDIVATAPLTVDAGASLDNVIIGTDSDITFAVSAASTTASGVSELATIAETDTGTDAVRVITPDGLEGSKWVDETIFFALFDSGTDTATGTTVQGDMVLPYTFIVSEVGAWMSTAGSGSVTTVDINEAGTSILSTKITIDDSEKHSNDAVAAPVISDSSIAAYAIITYDVDGVASGTAGKGLVVYIKGKKGV